jgi:hypothetical protein
MRPESRTPELAIPLRHVLCDACHLLRQDWRRVTPPGADRRLQLESGSSRRCPRRPWEQAALGTRSHRVGVAGVQTSAVATPKDSAPQRGAGSATGFDRYEGYRRAVSEPLLELLRKGDLDGTIEVLRAEPDAARKARSPITRLRAELLNAAGGARSSSWEGPAFSVTDAVDLAYLIALPAERAAAVGAVSPRAADALPQVIPEKLAQFVETWSTLFQRNPRNWDRIGHYPAMFLWVRDGHVSAPTQDGAVNLWLQFAPDLVHPPAAPGPGEPDGRLRITPQECAVLYTVTLPRLFLAEVRPGLGAAAIDHTSGGRVIDLIRHLIDTDVWSLEQTRTRLQQARASPARASAFQQRWLDRLDAVLT